MPANLEDLISDDDQVYHRIELDERFGAPFWDEVVNRMVATSIYTRHECEILLDDAIAYWIARSTLEDPSYEPLVANLGPDFAQHYLLLYTSQAAELSEDLAGCFIHHDPASESALVNNAAATAKTVAVFKQKGIRYHPRLWQDHIAFPFGARVIRTGIVGAEDWPVLPRRTVHAGTMAG